VRAEAVLKLRSLKVSGDLNAYWAFHFRREHDRNYPTAPIPGSVKEAELRPIFPQQNQRNPLPPLG